MKSQSQFYSRYFTYIKPIGKLPIVKTYGTTIFTLFIITIFIFFAIKPTVETILVLQKKIDDSTEVLEKVNQKAANLSEGKRNYEQLAPRLKAKMEALIPDAVSLKSIIQTLEISAKAHEASVSALQIQPLVLEAKSENQIGALTEVLFTFNAEGDYKDLILVLQDLKSSARLLTIESLSLSKQPEGVGLIMSIAGKAYYFK